jgi:Fe-S oxidoreductase
MKLELLFEEKLLKYEAAQEEEENRKFQEICQSLEELLTECRECQQNIASMSETIEEKRDELLKVKVVESLLSVTVSPLV